ncbi:putative protein C9E9,15 OS=Schizosaccharomyces pombe (strain 972 / ATCC 24843) GN=SPAC9E9.15 PE=3 SV=2 [Rhizoctonia solani AG-1 IB]|uniref:NADH:ubiquinone oxidoreductase intermediate-associated protein 30 domain-containing protein n=1 Tax=Thanatephorus cucumeris (strain AG1-IB / isolate 7/3/14) TaxID=1108050 RepID=A0A0B7FSM6_THACB|nr:putative protein C9E9,15 OS=Schizosaccharomyces pombe (strain 972 / ATCC 24843) GN=SPAC9E9.15 PE=3 SV=2 [Rhizoctonia solani AG-1 IB]
MSTTIFPPWLTSEWETVDDRIRGGKSVSTLQERNVGDGMWFSGTLDITALGGAGFASQRFRFSDKLLHLPRPEFQGIRLTLSPQPITLQNPREFTFILNTEPITHRPDGRVESRINWEAVFTDSAPSWDLAFDMFRATYRGRPVDPAPAFDSSTIYDLSLMCRSAFGKQYGPFQLHILSVEAIKLER